MTASPLRHPNHRLPHRSLSQRAAHALAYVTAALLGLSVGPALVMLADRATFLHWTNMVLDLVSRR